MFDCLSLSSCLSPLSALEAL